ncbi:hypothetical protein HOY82DRAFT_623719 [Tuber indicum]|nr:hypothetical protein HOY82DRAFT_623719 [Tuber indicum]
MFAALFACAMISGVSPAYGVEEMTCAPKAANAKLLIMLPGSIAVTVVAMERVGAPKERIFLRRATAETFSKDGWLHRISNCVREVIKVNGVAVVPVGTIDLGHPVVEDFTVLGMPQNTIGGESRGYVMLKRAYRDKDNKAMEEEIVEFVERSKSTNLKWLWGSLRFLDVTSKSPSGKILNNVLRDGVGKGQEVGEVGDRL